MKTINLSDETYKKLAILKIEREATSFDILIDFLVTSFHKEPTTEAKE